MGSVTLFNAARMQAIEDGTVTSGLVDENGHLILYRHDGSTYDSGNVIGPQGDPGTNGTDGADAVLPGELSPDGKKTTDWNTALTTGFYYSDTLAANSPYPAAYCSGIVMANGGTSGVGLKQIGWATTIDASVRMTRYSYDYGIHWSTWIPEMPPLPNLKRVGNNGGSFIITSASGVWQSLSTPLSVSFTLTRALRVKAHYSSQLAGTATIYSMLGVVCSGALALNGEDDQLLGTSYFGYCPFTFSTTSMGVSGTKIIDLPVGTTKLEIMGRRNGTTGTQSITYPLLTVAPEQWL